MAEKEKDTTPVGGGGGGEKGQEGSSSAATAPKRARKTKPKSKPPQPLPPWKVLLHNDDTNEIGYVVRTIVELTPLGEHEAKQRTIEAHETKVALLLTTHKERAELYQEQFQSKGLTVTIEPAEK
jgi:ATP-dependent Clp protease adaptor protein ClpS